MKAAVIPGASSGMGREFVIQISKKEVFDEIWVIARQKEKLEQLQAACSSTVIRPVPLDLTDSDAVDAYAALLKEKCPEVSLLVNASGFGKFAPIEEIGPAV